MAGVLQLVELPPVPDDDPSWDRLLPLAPVVHPASRDRALARAPGALLGRRPGDVHDVRAVVGMDRVPGDAHPGLCDVRARPARAHVRPAVVVRVAAVPPAGHRGGARPRRVRVLLVAAVPRPRSDDRAAARVRLRAARGPDRDQRHGALAHVLERATARCRLRVPRDPAPRRGGAQPDLHPVRQVLPRGPTAGDARRAHVQGHVAGGHGRRDVPRVRRAAGGDRVPGEPPRDHGGTRPALRRPDLHLPAMQARRARQGLPRPCEARVLVSGFEQIVPPGVADFREVGRTPADDWKAAESGLFHLVSTHCCYCGVQCGMDLKVSEDGRVFGLEPNMHDINKGKLCPKGVTAYQQVNHPDRLLYPLVRDGRASDLRRASWDEALDRVASEIQRIQETYGRDAFGVYSGSSLTTEVCYLMGKFARVALRTRNVDYNGRLCMVSAAAANKKAFGIDRAANPWADMLDTNVIMIAGSNVAEVFPGMTHYVWGARDRGATLIVVDPRETPVARTADVHVPLRPGTDSAFFNGVLHVVVREGWIDEGFIAERTTGWDEVRQTVDAYDPARVGDICGISPDLVERVARMWGTVPRAMAFHARGIEHQIQGVENALSIINLVLATGQIGAPGKGYGTITGQGNGQGGREHGQKADQLPGQRSISNPEHRKHVCQVWGLPAAELPQAGVSVVEMFQKMREREIRGLLSICNNVMVSLPDTNKVRESLEGLDFYVCVDFFMSEGARYADVVLPGSAWSEDEGVTTNSEGRVVKINQANDPPGEARQDWWIVQEIARRMGREKYFAFDSPREMFEELRVASRGGNADYFGITWEKIEQNNGIFWPCPAEDHPGTPRLFEDRFYHPDGKAKFHPVDYTGPKEVPDEEFPLILTSGRVVYQYLSGNQTRRIGFLVEQFP